MTPSGRTPRWIVTGGSGFVGRHIVAAAKAKGASVLTVDRLPSDGEHVVVNLTDPGFRRIVAKESPSVIVHAAGPASVRDSFSDPQGDFEKAVLPWLHVLEAARSLPTPPKVVSISSAAVYGSPARLPVAESDRLEPLSPYGYHKVICERLAEEYATLHGVPNLVLRVFSVYGPAQRRLLPWELFLQSIGANSEIRLLGTGRETRDYIHIDDLGEWTVQAAALPWTGLRILNMASGSQVSTLQLAKAIMRHAGVQKPVLLSASTPKGDPPCWEADVTELRRLVGRAPRSLDDGLSNCVAAWLRERQP